MTGLGTPRTDYKDKGAIYGPNRAAQRLSQALLVALVCIVSAQVFYRYVLNASLIWSETVSAWCMVWIVFIGAVSTIHDDGAVSLPMVVTMLPPMARASAVISARIATIAANCYVAWYRLLVVTSPFNSISQATGLNTRYVKLCVPIGAALMALFTTVRLADDLRRLRLGGPNAVEVPGVRRTERPTLGPDLDN